MFKGLFQFTCSAKESQICLSKPVTTQHVHARTHTHACTHTHMHAHTHTHTHTHTHAYTHKCTHTHTHAHTHAYTHNVHTHTHMHIHTTYTHTHMHIHTNVHTHTQRVSIKATNTTRDCMLVCQKVTVQPTTRNSRQQTSELSLQQHTQYSDY